MQEKGEAPNTGRRLRRSRQPKGRLERIANIPVRRLRRMASYDERRRQGKGPKDIRTTWIEDLSETTMPKLTPAYIVAQECETAEHYEDLAEKARKAGDGHSAAEYLSLANISRRQMTRVEQEAIVDA